MSLGKSANRFRSARLCFHGVFLIGLGQDHFELVVADRIDESGPAPRFELVVDFLAILRVRSKFPRPSLFLSFGVMAFKRVSGNGGPLRCPLEAKSVEGCLEVVVAGPAAMIIGVFQAAAPMIGQPVVDIALPIGGQVIFPLELPRCLAEVLVGRFVFPLAVVGFVEHQVISHAFGQFVVLLERFRDSARLKTRSESIDVTNRPMTVALENHVGVVAVAEGLHGLFDGGGVALVEQARIPIVGVDDGPVLGPFWLSEPAKDENLAQLPAAS